MGRNLAIAALSVAILAGLFFVVSRPAGESGEALNRTEDPLSPAGRGEPDAPRVELAQGDGAPGDSGDGNQARESAGIRRRAARVRKRFVETTELTLADKRMVVSGSELKGEAPGIRSATTRTVAVVDDYSSADGNVAGLVREFEEGAFDCTLDTTYRSSSSGESRVVNQVLVGDSKWTGQSVRFEWDAKARRHVARSASDELDASKLVGDLDFTFFAPDSRLEEWTIDVSRLAPLLAPAGDLALDYRLPDGPALNTGALGFNIAACIGKLSGDVTLTRGDKKFRSGRELLEIDVKINLTSKRDATPDALAVFREDRRYGTLRKLTLELTLAATGTVTWDVEQGCVTAFTLSGPSHITAEGDHETDMQGELIKSSVAFEMMGSTRLELVTTELD